MGDLMEKHKDYLLLWGGVDINPEIYKQQPHPNTQRPNNHRDLTEIMAVREAIDNGIPIIGVCRGAQLLCALNGGTLYQHTNDHGCSHDVYTDDQHGHIEIIKRVAAGHHQVMNPKGNFVVYGYDGRESTVYESDGSVAIKLEHAPEVVWWPDTKCLGIQPHPEWMPSNYPFNIWINKLIFELTGLQGVF